MHFFCLYSQNQFFGGGGAGNFGGAGRGGGPGRAGAPDLFPKGKSKVARLGKPKFPNDKSKHMWMILFYSNDDDVSLQLAPVYESLAEKKNLPYKVGAVDCHKSEREAKFCNAKKIEEVPEIAMVLDGKLNFMKDLMELESAKDLHTFALEHMPQKLIQNINNLVQLKERLLDKKRPAVFLLTDKYETGTMFYSLAYQFRNQFVFGESRAQNLQLGKEFGVKKYPHLVFFDGKGSRHIYEGTVKKEQIVTWLDKLATIEAESGSKRRRATGENFYGSDEL